MKNNNYTSKDNEKLNELFDAMASVSFDPAERAALARRLSEFIDANPVSSSTPSPASLPLESPYAVPVSLRHRLSFIGRISSIKPRKLMPVALVLIFVLAGSTSVAAEGALPGDILYPVKIHVNEQVSTMLSVGAKSTAKTQISHVDTRLAEAEKLSSQNRLSTENQATVKAGFEADAEKVANHVKNLVAEGKAEAAAEVSSDFEASLESHRDLLVALSEKGDNQRDLLADLAGVVNAKLDTSFNQGQADSASAIGIAEANPESQDAGGAASGTLTLMATRKANSPANQAATKSKNIATTTALSADASVKAKAKAEGARISAKNKIDIAHEYINDKGDELDSSLSAAARGQANEAQRLYNQGEMQFSAGEYGQAYIFFNQSSRYAQRAKLVLDSGAEIKSVISTFLKMSNDGNTTGTTTSQEFHSSKKTNGGTVKIDSKITATTSASKSENKSENGGSIRIENTSESQVENNIEIHTSTGGTTIQGTNGQNGADGQAGSAVNVGL